MAFCNKPSEDVFGLILDRSPSISLSCTPDATIETYGFRHHDTEVSSANWGGRLQKVCVL